MGDTHFLNFLVLIIYIKTTTNFRLTRELFRDSYTFDTHSVIFPGKRPFVHRQKRIKALKLSGVDVTPQKDNPNVDESSRDSNYR